MSLDDETPTQYFGADAEVWTSPDGRTLQLSPTESAKFGPGLTKFGWTRSDREPLAIGPEIHRSGCSHSRTGKCLCDYLAQWDRAEPEDTKPLRDFTEQMAAEGRVITIDTLPGRVSEWDGVFTHPGTLAPRNDTMIDNITWVNGTTTSISGAGTLVIPDEMMADFDPSKVKLSGAPEFISASEYQRRQQEQGPTPFQLHLTDIEGNPMPNDHHLITEANQALKDATAVSKVQTEAYLQLHKKYLTQMKADHRTIVALFILSLGGWGLSIARGIWGF